MLRNFTRPTVSSTYKIYDPLGMELLINNYDHVPFTLKFN